MRTLEDIQDDFRTVRGNKIFSLQKEYANAVENERRKSKREKFIARSEARAQTNLQIYQTTFENGRLIIL